MIFVERGRSIRRLTKNSQTAVVLPDGHYMIPGFEGELGQAARGSVRAGELFEPHRSRASD